MALFLRKVDVEDVDVSQAGDAEIAEIVEEIEEEAEVPPVAAGDERDFLHVFHPLQVRH